MEQKFGTGGALASAFVSGFYPLCGINHRNPETTAAGGPNVCVMTPYCSSGFFSPCRHPVCNLFRFAVSREAGVMEQKFGIGGALASAFVSGFYPLCGINHRNPETTAAGGPNVLRNDSI